MGIPSGIHIEWITNVLQMESLCNLNGLLMDSAMESNWNGMELNE
jgi:hypothetical protein